MNVPSAVSPPTRRRRPNLQFPLRKIRARPVNSSWDPLPEHASRGPGIHPRSPNFGRIVLRAAWELDEAVWHHSGWDSRVLPGIHGGIHASCLPDPGPPRSAQVRPSRQNCFFLQIGKSTTQIRGPTHMSESKLCEDLNVQKLHTVPRENDTIQDNDSH